MRVRVKARGFFKGQVVDVLRTDQNGRWYQLAVTWQGKIRPSWFEAYEVELLEEEAQPEPESKAR